MPERKPIGRKYHENPYTEITEIYDNKSIKSGVFFYFSEKKKKRKEKKEVLLMFCKKINDVGSVTRVTKQIVPKGSFYTKGWCGVDVGCF